MAQELTLDEETKQIVRDLVKALDAHNRGMRELAREIHNMPHSMRIRP